MGESKEVKPVNLHLGCWKRKLPGYVHIDLCDYKHIDHNTSVDKLPMFEDKSVDLIYASHVLEYFTREEAVEVLKEWRRVLKRGGKLMVAVPDFAKLTIAYRKYRDMKKILGPIYGHMTIKTDKGKKEIYHKTMYDYLSLMQILKKAKFKDVKKYKWEKTIHKFYDDHSRAHLPHSAKAIKDGSFTSKHMLISLNMEGTK